MKILVAYYSRTNTTKQSAEEIAKKLNADIEEITSKVNYSGKLGYAKGIKDAINEKIVDLETLKYDPSDYDLIYLGVPVWSGKSANPILSYIKQNEGKFPDVKFFVTAGSSGFENAFNQMATFIGKEPLKTLELTSKEIKNNDYINSLNNFLE